MPLSEREIKARENEQKSDIYFREAFLGLGLPTQQKIVDLLEKMENSIEKGKSGKAQEFFFSQIGRNMRSRNGSYIDRKGVDWWEVSEQIKNFCFGDHDMDGYTIVSRRVGQSLTVFRSLMELPSEK